MVTKKEMVILILVWAVITLLGEILASNVQYFPSPAAQEAAIVDGAFRALVALAMPVFTFVLAVLGYSLLRFRSKGQPAQDGPPVRSHKGVVATWFAITGALCLLVIIYPGVTGLAELRARAREKPDLVVQVEGARWFWKITYPDYRITTYKELVLPVDKHVHFMMTSKDVLHAFWVPGFRAKIDAVPGMTTMTDSTPNMLGTFQEDPNFRLQCTQLCGTGHTIMAVPVRVVTQSEFDAWIAQQTKQAMKLEDSAR